MITGKFEFGDGSGSAAGSATSANPDAAAGGLGEVLSGGIAAMPASQAAAERQRTKEAQRIIGMVEPGNPTGLGGGGAGGGQGQASARAKDKECLLQ